MNNDLISREALIQDLQSAKYLCYDNNSISRIQNHEIDRCISFVEDAPTVDLDERDIDAFETGYIKGLCENRPTGEWIDRNGNTTYPFWLRYECSICHGYSGMADYCYHCGAKMKGEEE